MDRVALLRLAGVLLVVAGAVYAGSAFATGPLSYALAAAQGVALLATFLALVRARFPNEGAGRSLAIALAVVYGLSAVTVLLVTTDVFALLAILMGLVTLAIGLAYGVVAFRTPGLDRRLGILPLVLFLGLFLAGQLASRVLETWAALMPALVYLVVGILLVALAPRFHGGATTDAAS